MANGRKENGGDDGARLLDTAIWGGVRLHWLTSPWDCGVDLERMGKQQLHELIDRLPESETGAAARYLQFLLAHGDEAPVDPLVLHQIDLDRKNDNGQWIPHDESYA